MKVTLEQIDELRARVNVSYEEAKETLEKNDGDLIKSIIELENKKGRKNEYAGRMRHVSNRLLNLRISVKSKEGEVLLNLPLVIILAIFMMAFWVVIFSFVLAVLTSCKIKIYRDTNLNVNNLKKNVKETVEKFTNKTEENIKADIEVKTEEDNEENEIIIE